MVKIDFFDKVNGSCCINYLAFSSNSLRELHGSFNST